MKKKQRGVQRDLSVTMVANGRYNGGEHDEVLQVLEAKGQLVQIPGARRLRPDCLVPALAILWADHCQLLPNNVSEPASHP